MERGEQRLQSDSVSEGVFLGSVTHNDAAVFGMITRVETQKKTGRPDPAALALDWISSS